MASTKVFVGSLPPGSKPEELRHLFESYGIVTECDIMNRCGFVHMETSDMAENAIKALHDTQFKGQNIVVEAGRPKDKKRSGGLSGGRGGNRDAGGSRGVRRGSGPMSGRGGNRGGMLGGGRQGGPSNNRGGNFSGSRGNGRGGQRLDRNNDVGPIRNDSGRGQQRNMPYTRGGGGGTFSADKYVTPGRTKFGGFNNDGFEVSEPYDNWQSRVPENARGGRGFIESKSFGKGGFSGGNQNQMTGSMGNQDRRGFALPGGGQQRFGENDSSRFGASSDNIADSPMFSRRHNAHNMLDGPNGFGHTPRGGGRGGFGVGRGGSGNGRSSFRGGRVGLNRGGMEGAGSNRNNSNHSMNFHNDFPPLNSGFNRNAPRDMMSNRRY